MIKVFYLVSDQVRSHCQHYIQKAPEGYCVEVREPSRTKDQNAAQWPILDAFAQQVKWPVNGEMIDMTSEEWKDVLTAAFTQETMRVAKGLRGGVVMLGKRTSKFGKKKFSEWIEFLHAEAAEQGVVVYPAPVKAAA